MTSLDIRNGYDIDPDQIINTTSIEFTNNDLLKAIDERIGGNVAILGQPGPALLAVSGLEPLYIDVLTGTPQADIFELEQVVPTSQAPIGITPFYNYKHKPFKSLAKEYSLFEVIDIDFLSPIRDIGETRDILVFQEADGPDHVPGFTEKPKHSYSIIQDFSPALDKIQLTREFEFSFNNVNPDVLDIPLLIRLDLVGGEAWVEIIA